MHGEVKIQKVCISIFVRQINLVCYDYMDACQKYGRNSSAFDRVCEEAVESVTNPQPLYDVILVDEAQDFSKYFLSDVLYVTPT